MLSIRSKFVKSESASLAPVFALSLLPLLLAVGLSVDYTSATTTKAGMQSALDAASLSIVTLPKDTSLADRETALQAAFLGNGGEGAAKLNAFSIASDGTVNLQASAAYAMPTNFMQLAMIKAVPLGVMASVNKTPALVEATFNVDHVSGYWGKTMYLYGTAFNSSTPQVLMKITYTYKEYKYSYEQGSGSSKKTYTATDPKGYGTANVYTVSGTTETLAQSQVCTPVGSKTDFTPSATVFRSFATATSGKTNGSTIYFKTQCVTTNIAGNSGGAKIDVSMMDKLYLLMDVPSGPITKLRSDDTNTSDRLYIGAGYTTADDKSKTPSKYLPVEVAKNKVVDIFTAVPCSETSDQAWEDGGNNPPLPDVTNADFFYSVTGKCDFNKRPSETVLTQ